MGSWNEGARSLWRNSMLSLLLVIRGEKIKKIKNSIAATTKLEKQFCLAWMHPSTKLV